MKRSSKPGGRRRRSKPAWREGTVQEFLDLSESQAALIRTKVALAVRLQRRREALAWSQTELAQRIGSGQSRVAKMEAAHPSVSLELLVRALLATGASMAEIGAVVSTGDPGAPVRVRHPAAKRAKRSRRPAAPK